jgi:hypothetical protein
MDHHRFATVTRTLRQLPSRRDILHGLVGIGVGLGPHRVADTAVAKSKHHKKGKRTKQPQTPSPPCAPRCGRKECGDDGCGGSCGSCSADRPCLSGTCVCFSDPANCAGHCGPVIDNCGDLISCGPCPAGQQCLTDGTCA